MIPGKAKKIKTASFKRFAMTKEWLNGRSVPLKFELLAWFPGLSLILLGLCALYAPQFLLLTVASVLVAVGVVFIFVGYRLLRAFKDVSSIFNELKDKVAVHTVQIRTPSQAQPSAEEIKKIIIH